MDDKNSTSDKGYLLVIDDEEDVLRVIRTGLVRYGHTVMAFSDPHKALEEFRLNYQDYELILTDVRMPGISGIELAKQAKKIHPNIQVLVMTAFELTQYELEQDLPFIRIEDVLKKPFALGKICKVIDAHINAQRR